MPKKSWVTLLIVFLPLLLGALASFLAQWMWNPVPVLVFKIDVGMVVFITGVFITLCLIIFWLGGASKETRTTKLIEESLRESEEGRRRFLRRLDHEIKNPLTGLRAALVNLQEARVTEERQRAGENASHAMDRLTRLLTDLRKLSDLDEWQIERMPVDMPE